MFKRYFSMLIYILVTVIVISPNIAFGTDVWSTPTYTEQWSSPTYTEPWTEPIYTEPWSIPDLLSPPPASEQNIAEPSKPSTYIKLQIGNKNATVQDQNIQIDVPPITINGRTMVPVRFLGEEALKAKVDWDNNAQKATLTLNDKKIELVVGKSVGLVNGKEIPLDVPVTIKDGRILVPLRFVSENLGLFVKYDDPTKTIEISDKPLRNGEGQTLAEGSKPGSQQQTTKDIATTESENEEPIVDFEKLYGTWYLWTPSNATSLYDKTTGNYVTHEFNQGADQGKVVINKDGTYTMTHAAWAKGVTVEGKWRLSFPAEINGERIQSIVLLNGITNVDWAVAPSENGKIRLLYAMRWADGSATWVFDSELYKK